MLHTPDGVADVHILSVCWICQRERATTGRPTPTRARACGRCLRLDSLLARPYGMRLLTPLVDPGTAEDGILRAHLLPGAGREVTGQAQERHMTRLAAVARRAEADGVRHLVARWPGSSTGRFLRWVAWQEYAPPSLVAIVAGYQDYVREVHPWVDSVEPRVADPEWLVGLLEGRGTV